MCISIAIEANPASPIWSGDRANLVHQDKSKSLQGNPPSMRHSAALRNERNDRIPVTVLPTPGTNPLSSRMRLSRRPRRPRSTPNSSKSIPARFRMYHAPYPSMNTFWMGIVFFASAPFWSVERSVSTVTVCLGKAFVCWAMRGNRNRIGTELSHRSRQVCFLSNMFRIS